MKCHHNAIAYYYLTGQEAKLREQLQEFNKSVSSMKVEHGTYEILNFINSKPKLLEKLLLSPFDYQHNEYMKKLLIYTAVREACIDSIDILYKKRIISDNLKIEEILIDFDNHLAYPNPVSYTEAIANKNILALQKHYHFDLFFLRKIIVNNALAEHDFSGLDKLLASSSQEQIEQIKLTLAMVKSLGRSNIFISKYLAGNENIKTYHPKVAQKDKLENKELIKYIDIKVEKIMIEANTSVESKENNRKVVKL